MRSSLKSLAVASVMFAGCAADVSGPDDNSETTQAVQSTNKIAMNKIAMNKIELNRIGSDQIAGHNYGNGHYAVSATTATMLSTSDGRDLFGYVVSCALDKHVTLEATVAGVNYEFPGNIGLAPEWVHQNLHSKSQHWVSACILARVNAHDISLLISMRGPTGALNLAQGEAATYSLEEGAFYGQIFVPETQDIIAYACEGRDQAAGEPATGPLHDRDCTELADNSTTTTQCGMRWAGTCADFTDADARPHRWTGHDEADEDDEGPHACESQSYSGYYRDCHTQSSDANGEFPNHSDYDQVITVYVSP